MVRKLILLCATLPCLVNAQKLDSQHILIDAECSNPQPFTYTTFQDASAHFIDNITIYVKPGVYWIDSTENWKLESILIFIISDVYINNVL